MTDVVATIKEVGAILTPIVLAWIAYKQIKLSGKQKNISDKQDVIHEQINGMQGKMVVAEKAESELIGVAKGIAQQRKDGDTTANAVVDKIKKDKDIDVTKSK